MIELGYRSYVNGQPILRGDLSKVIVGKYCSIGQDVIFDCGSHHNIDFISTFPFSAFYEEGKYIKIHPKTKGDIIIGNDVWIGEGAMIMGGITIGHGAVIGAKSVVTKDVAAYSLVAGNPAVFKKFRFLPSTIDHLLSFKWWDKEEQWIKNNIENLMQSKPEKI